MSEHGCFVGRGWIEETLTGGDDEVRLDSLKQGGLSVGVDEGFREGFGPDKPRVAWVRIEVTYPVGKPDGSSAVVGRAVYIDPDEFLAAAAAMKVLIARVKKDEKL